MGDFSFTAADADQYVISLAGVNLALGAGQGGFGADEFFSLSQVFDSFFDTAGVDGSVARSKSQGQTVYWSIVLMQTSKTNDYLSHLHALDCNQPGGRGVGSFNVRDLQGLTYVHCSACWIKRPADAVLGRGVKARKWSFAGVWSVYNPAGEVSP